MKKNDNGDVVYYIRSSVLGGQVVAEIRNWGYGWSWSRGYVYWPGGELLAIQAGGVKWVHRDPVVKSQRLTDEAGSVVAVVELDPWGGETDRSVNQRQQPYLYTTYERDGDGVDQALMRSYHGWWTRFNEPDPWEGSYDLTDPQSFNRYAYVRNDPVNYVDPDGLFALNREYFEAMEALWELWLFGMQMNQRLLPPLVDGAPFIPAEIGSLQNLIDVSRLGDPPRPHCGVNPVTGQPGFNREPIGQPGHLRDPRGGEGQWQARRASRNGRVRRHLGLDIAGEENVSPIYANRSGRVIYSGMRTDPAGRAYGNLIIIDHGDGVQTRYAHNARNLVREGEDVTQGQQIGVVGATGNARGLPSHVHFEVWVNGERRDPERYLNSFCP
ncbi:peptidoglycan DD-metalloendopeptidase family protein [Pyrinomonas methylaliphatogenes]|uniref:peptidoglycan DD-metalloendopeptidase family protein n=1 Tax=Pyrinomonas methylaliphatogenes TaxID=454194 RepID=UPI00138E0B46|nr:peptidoglycan DD-metalloendopeptidase family protein [Pyrinomonas methylaliphatogenes]